MNIEITEEYKASLVPFPKETLEPLKLPTETFVFLTETGLPLHAGYEITPNAPITFLSMPTIKKYPYLQHPYPNRGRKDRVRPLAVVFLKNTDNREEIIRLLIEYGADPSLADKPGQTAFALQKLQMRMPI